ncbi:MAG: SDR family oxidoreductase [Rhizobiaceae bacterium]
MNRRYFLFGAGYSARGFARLIDGQDTIAGTTRSRDRFPLLERAGVTPLVFDGEMTPDLAAILAETTHLIVSVAPDGEGDPVLRAARRTIVDEMPALRWIGYLSTVGVYGDHGGAWVDEASACRPKSRRSIDRLAAERDWLALGEEIVRPVAVFRLSGIYGPGRNAFVNLRNGTAKRLVKAGQVFNRIHVDDIAGALRHSAEADMGGIFNVTDNEPAPPQDVVAHAAAIMGVAPPPETPFDTAELTPMARSFYGENKRVSNRALRATGYAFVRPDYRSGLEAMWAGGSWAGEATDMRAPIRKD